MRIGDFKAWIICEDKTLPEYSIEPESNNSTTVDCFIPSETGKSFRVYWQNSTSQYFAFKLTMDGSFVAWYPTPPGPAYSPGVRMGSAQIRPYQFSPVVTTDGDGALQPLGDLGVIEVSVRHVVPYDWKGREFPSTWQPTGSVHEQLKKAGTHYISLGDAHEEKPVTTPDYAIDDKKPEPVACFRFRYRPVPLLQAQGIIPFPDLNPQAGPSIGTAQEKGLVVSVGDGRVDSEAEPKKRRRLSKSKLSRRIAHSEVKGAKVSDPPNDEDDLGTLKSELIQILYRIEGIEKKKRKKKRKRKTTIESSSGKVKKEEPGTSQRLSGEVIDLTLSDS